MLEAMACRCPLVATETGAAPDLIENGRNGFLVDVEDAIALADRIVDVLSLSPDEWRKMSDAAYERASSYSWSDATDLFERAILERIGT